MLYNLKEFQPTYWIGLNFFGELNQKTTPNNCSGYRFKSIFEVFCLLTKLKQNMFGSWKVVANLSGTPKTKTK